MSHLISSNRVNVSVGHQIFSIPSEKINEVLNLLTSLQSIQVSEHPSPYLQYKGKSIINEIVR